MSIHNLKLKIEKIIEYLKGEIVSLRTSRANPAMVENIEVDYYGAKTPIKALASILSPDPKQIIIQPWDKNAIQPIEKAISASTLGINPIADKDAIRLSIPALTEERRRELTKTLGKHIEEARIKIRKEREDTLREIDRKEKAKEVSEDEKFRQKNEVQKLVDDANKKIEEIGKTKEKEIMTV